MDQTVEHHRLRQLARLLGKSHLRQDLIHPESLPHLVSGVKGSRGARVRRRHQIDTDLLDEGFSRRRNGPWLSGFPPDLFDQFGGLRILDQRGLARQGALELVSESEPLMRRARVEAAEGADDAMAGTFWGGDGLDEAEVVVCLAADSGGVLLQEHED